MEPTTHLHHATSLSCGLKRVAAPTGESGFLDVFEGLRVSFEALPQLQGVGEGREEAPEESLKSEASATSESHPEMPDLVEGAAIETENAETVELAIFAGERGGELSESAPSPAVQQPSDRVETSSKLRAATPPAMQADDALGQQTAQGGAGAGFEVAERGPFAPLDLAASSKRASPVGTEGVEKRAPDSRSMGVIHMPRGKPKNVTASGEQETQKVAVAIEGSWSERASPNALNLGETRQPQIQLNAQNRPMDQTEALRPIVGLNALEKLPNTNGYSRVSPQHKADISPRASLGIDAKVAVSAPPAPNESAKMGQAGVVLNIDGSQQTVQPSLESGRHSAVLAAKTVPSQMPLMAGKTDRYPPPPHVPTSVPQPAQALVPRAQDATRLTTIEMDAVGEAQKLRPMAAEIEFPPVTSARSLEVGGSSTLSETSRATTFNGSIELARSVSAQLKAQVSTVTSAGFEVALKPVELGHVRLALVAGDAGSTLLIHAERVETLDLMRRHIGILEQDLRAMGHETLSLKFSNGGFSGQMNQNSRQEASPQNGGEGHLQDLTEPLGGMPQSSSDPRTTLPLNGEALDLRL